MDSSISLQSGRTVLICWVTCTNLRSRNPPRPKSAIISCCRFSASSFVLTPHRVSSTENCYLMFMAPAKSTSIHILQAVANSMQLDNVLMCYHTLLFPPRISSLVLIGTLPPNSLQISIVLTNLHFAAIPSYICSECNLVCSES